MTLGDRLGKESKRVLSGSSKAHQGSQAGGTCGPLLVRDPPLAICNILQYGFSPWCCHHQPDDVSIAGPCVKEAHYKSTGRIGMPIFCLTPRWKVRYGDHISPKASEKKTLRLSRVRGVE